MADSDSINANIGDGGNYHIETHQSKRYIKLFRCIPDVNSGEYWEVYKPNKYQSEFNAHCGNQRIVNHVIFQSQKSIQAYRWHGSEWNSTERNTQNSRHSG